MSAEFAKALSFGEKYMSTSHESPWTVQPTLRMASESFGGDVATVLSF